MPTFFKTLLFVTLLYLVVLVKSSIEGQVKELLYTRGAEKILKCFHETTPDKVIVDRIELGCGTEYSPKSIRPNDLLINCGITEIEFENYGILNTKSGTIMHFSRSKIDYQSDRNETFRIGKVKWTYAGFSYESEIEKMSRDSINESHK